MNAASNLVLRSQSGEQFDAVVSISSVLEVFGDVVCRAASRDDLVTFLARASAAELEARLTACDDYLAEDCDTAVSDAVQLAIDGLRFSYAQLRAIAVVADADVANQAINGAALISAELIDPESIWVRV
jgi:hypothetical protein